MQICLKGTVLKSTLGDDILKNLQYAKRNGIKFVYHNDICLTVENWYERLNNQILFI